MRKSSRFLSLIRRVHLCEASLRLLAALGSGSHFPDDLEGIETLLARVAKGRDGEMMDFEAAPPGGLPRYTGQHLIWVSPATDGCLRLRYESGELSCETAILTPDGRIERLESITGFGVPDSQLTGQAIADREAVKRRAQELASEEIEVSRQIDEERQRFRTEHLLGVRAAPPQDPDGLMVTFVVFYDTGVVVYCLLPRQPDAGREIGGPWAEPLPEEDLPRITLTDRLGTTFQAVGWRQEDAGGYFLRASQYFIPAVPDEASHLWVEADSRRVKVGVCR